MRKIVEMIRELPVKIRGIPRRTLIIICINTLLLISLLITSAVASGLTKRLDSQTAAKRWGQGGGDMRFAQVSAFFTSDSDFKSESIRGFREKIDQKLKEASITAGNEGARLWVDAFSTEGKVRVTGPRASSDTTATAVGGDFFLFHEFKLISGYYFLPDDVMKDRLVLDELAAWQLFGSMDVAGMQVTINTKVFVVAGVISRPDTWPDEDVYGETPRIIMSIEAYEQMNANASIMCYEAIIPDPVSSFAINMITENLPVSKENTEAIENSGRFSLFSRFGTLSDFMSRTVRDKAISYPYWENSARIVDNYLALLLLLELLLPLFTVVCIAVVIIKLWHRRSWKGKSIFLIAEEIKDFADEKKRKRQLTKLLNEKDKEANNTPEEEILEEMETEINKK